MDSSTLTAPIAPNYRGVSWRSRRPLDAALDRERGLSTGDSRPIESLTYGNLSAILVHRHDPDLAVEHARRVACTSSVSVQMIAQ